MLKYYVGDIMNGETLPGCFITEMVRYFEESRRSLDGIVEIFNTGDQFDKLLTMGALALYAELVRTAPEGSLSPFPSRCPTCPYMKYCKGFALITILYSKR